MTVSFSYYFIHIYIYIDLPHSTTYWACLPDCSPEQKDGTHFDNWDACAFMFSLFVVKINKRKDISDSVWYQGPKYIDLENIMVVEIEYF